MCGLKSMNRNLLRFLLVAAFGGAFGFSFAIGTAAGISLDAGWWGTLTAAGRLGAVEGSTDAYVAGWARGYTDGAAAKRTHAVPTFSHTFGYYVSAVTDFYETHDRVRQVTIGPIMGCLADKPTTSCNTLAREATTGE